MPGRFICEVFEEMRKLYETRNFSSLLGLIEEAQIFANRMEAALGEKKDYENWYKKSKVEKEEYKKLLEETNKMRKELGKEEKEFHNY